MIRIKRVIHMMRIKHIILLSMSYHVLPRDIPDESEGTGGVVHVKP